MSQSASLRLSAELEASRLPALLAQARHLAGTVMLGEHGRRRAGQGDDFWQYRALQQGDSLRNVDWRRSARGDVSFVKEREWQIAQSVQIWVNTGASMRFASSDNLSQKAERANVLALAAAILLLRGGERVGMTGLDVPPRRGDGQIMRIAEALIAPEADDYAPPQDRGMVPHARALFVSDFLSDLEPVRHALTKAADRGVRGVLLQVLDPAEEQFPFRGRTVFESVGQTVRHETLKANALQEAYLARLAERKAELDALCRATGWLYGLHHTGESAQSALLWLHRAISGGAV